MSARQWTMWLVIALATAPAHGQSYPSAWTARWVWLNDMERNPPHFFLMARKTFELSAAPRAASLHVTGADRYVLYVNGEYVGRGPARSGPYPKSYDTRNVSALLRPGKNVVAVLAYHYGVSNNYGRDERAGLFAQLDVTLADGTVRHVGTDSSWRVRPAAAWSRDVDHVSQHHGALGITEVYNANADPPNWMAVDFDDASWSPAWQISVPGGPWTQFEARWTPLLEEREAFPVAVSSVGEVMQLNRMTDPHDIPERLAVEFTFPLEHARVDDADALLAADGRATIIDVGRHNPNQPLAVGVRSPFVVLDFGRPVFGFPQVRLKGKAGGIVDMGYGPCLINGRVPTMIGGLRLGDRYTMREGEQTWRTFEYKQFRYVVLVFRDLETPIEVESASVVEYRYPAEQVGRFDCSDPVLTKLWRACVDTTYLSMEDALICDATRERRVFTGDGAHGLFGVYAGFGDVAISDWYFRLIARGVMPDGMLRITYPGTEQPAGGGDLKAMTVAESPVYIPQSALVFAEMAGVHHEYFADDAFAAMITPTLARLAAWCEAHADESGLLGELPGWNWIDWSQTDVRGCNFQTNALYAATLNALAAIDTDNAASWRERAQHVRDGLRARHWNAERGLFVDSVIGDQQSDVATEVSNGMALMWGIADDEQARTIVAHFERGDAGMVEPSPLYHHYVVEGLIAAGADKLALRLLSERFGPMMNFTDAPTVWESFWPFVRVRGVLFRGELPSWVHTGGVGPAWTLTRHVLGVTSTQPSFARCRIEPVTGDLAWARGTFPSKRGPISVDWRRENGTFHLSVELPDDLPATLVPPRDPQQPVSFTHNGVSHTITGERPVEIDVTGGRHELAINY